MNADSRGKMEDKAAEGGVMEGPSNKRLRRGQSERYRRVRWAN